VAIWRRLAILFANENKNACGQCHNIEQENGRTKIQAESQKAVGQGNREQKRPLQ